MSAGRAAVSAGDAAASSSAEGAEGAASSSAEGAEGAASSSASSAVSAERAAMSAGRAAEVVTVPEATPEELAAILAAYEALWPDPAGPAAPAPSPVWRYAGRPWRRRRAWGGWS